MWCGFPCGGGYEGEKQASTIPTFLSARLENQALASLKPALPRSLTPPPRPYPFGIVRGGRFRPQVPRTLRRGETQRKTPRVARVGFPVEFYVRPCYSQVNKPKSQKRGTQPDFVGGQRYGIYWVAHVGKRIDKTCARSQQVHSFDAVIELTRYVLPRETCLYGGFTGGQ